MTVVSSGRLCARARDTLIYFKTDTDRDSDASGNVITVNIVTVTVVRTNGRAQTRLRLPRRYQVNLHRAFVVVPACTSLLVTTRDKSATIVRSALDTRTRCTIYFAVVDAATTLMEVTIRQR